MKKYQISFLINPVSGDGLGLKVYAQIPEIMRSFGYEEKDWNASLTEVDQLVPQTRDALRESYKVIAVGGDGTMGLVLSQLAQDSYDQTQVGLIPMGTGNDLGRILGVYSVYKQRGLLACIKRLLKASATDFNLWNVEQGHTMAAYFSMGMDACILHDVDKARKRAAFSHNVFINKMLFLKYFLRRKDYRIQEGTFLKYALNGEVRSLKLAGSCSCIIANINSYGGGSSPSRNIDFNDDRLDILFVKSALSFFVYMVFARFFRSPPHWIRRMAQIHQAEKIWIKASPQEFFQIDGEFFPHPGQPEGITISRGRRVSMLDLRKTPFTVF